MTSYDDGISKVNKQVEVQVNKNWKTRERAAVQEKKKPTSATNKSSVEPIVNGDAGGAPPITSKLKKKE